MGPDAILWQPRSDFMEEGATIDETRRREPDRIAIVIPTWNRGASAARCVRALAPALSSRCIVIVVDSASRAAERAILDAAVDAVSAPSDVTVTSLPENRGFAGAVNAGLAAAFARGVDAVLVLNDDAVVDLPSIGILLAAAAQPGVGIVAPRVVDDESGQEVSRGERVFVPLLCVPRTWLRVRRADSTPYRVSSVLGVAFLVTRSCFDAVGLLAESFFAYYEEVDYCLRTRAAGLRIMVAPGATVRHVGFRGFVGGFTPLAAYLKTRNLPLVVRRHGGMLAWGVFLPTYLALVLSSALTYLVRGRREILPALMRGLADAARARSGPPPPAVIGTT